MEEKIFYLHITYHYEDSDGSNINDTTYEFREGSGLSEIEAEVNELGKPRITPEVLEVIRGELMEKHHAKVVIYNWQWFE